MTLSLPHAPHVAALVARDYVSLLRKGPQIAPDAWWAAVAALLPPAVLNELGPGPHLFPRRYQGLRFVSVNDFLEMFADVKTVEEAWEVWEARGLLPPDAQRERGETRLFRGPDGKLRDLPCTFAEALRFVARGERALLAEALLHEAEARFAALGVPRRPDARVVWNERDARVSSGWIAPWYNLHFNQLSLANAKKTPLHAVVRRIVHELDRERHWREGDLPPTGVGDCRAALVWALLEGGRATSHTAKRVFPVFSMDESWGVVANPFEPLVDLRELGVPVIYQRERWLLGL